MEPLHIAAFAAFIISAVVVILAKFVLRNDALLYGGAAVLGVSAVFLAIMSAKDYFAALLR